MYRFLVYLLGVLSKMAALFTSLTLADYQIVDSGIQLHFTANGALPGTVTDYYINLKDVEINSAANASQLSQIIQKKVDRLYSGVGVVSILNGDIGTIFTPATPVGIPAYFSDHLLGSVYIINPLSGCSLGTELDRKSTR